MKLSVYGLFLGVFSLVYSNAQTVQLDEVIQLALQKNYDVRVLQKTSALASNDNRFAYGAFFPLINANGSYLKNNNDSRIVTLQMLRQFVGVLNPR